jgi:hypothetical protein
MSDVNNTKVKCCLTGCKHNSACCANSCNECYCTLKNIDLIIDNETGMMDCKQYEYDYEKPYMCIDCQLEENSEIDITPEPVFIEVDDLDDLI